MLVCHPEVVHDLADSTFVRPTAAHAKVWCVRATDTSDKRELLSMLWRSVCAKHLTCGGCSARAGAVGVHTLGDGLCADFRRPEVCDTCQLGATVCGCVGVCGCVWCVGVCGFVGAQHSVQATSTQAGYWCVQTSQTT
eukprot:264972-Chlamydomonas_euryale.AAC.7